MVVAQSTCTNTKQEPGKGSDMRKERRPITQGICLAQIRLPCTLSLES